MFISYFFETSFAAIDLKTKRPRESDTGRVGIEQVILSI